MNPLYKGLTFKEAVRRERQVRWVLFGTFYVLGVLTGAACALAW